MPPCDTFVDYYRTFHEVFEYYFICECHQQLRLDCSLDCKCLRSRYTGTEIHTDRDTYRQRDRETERHEDVETQRYTDTWVHKPKTKDTRWHPDTEKETKRETERRKESFVLTEQISPEHGCRRWHWHPSAGQHQRDPYLTHTMYIHLGWVDRRAIQDRSLFIRNHCSKPPFVDMNRHDYAVLTALVWFPHARSIGPSRQISDVMTPCHVP